MLEQLLITRHAGDRIEDRDVPAEMVGVFKRRDCLCVKGGGGYAQHVNFLIIRVCDGYWVGVEAADCLITTIFVSLEASLRGWFRKRLQNPEEVSRIYRAPITISWRRVVTQELEALWCSGEEVG